MCPHQLQLRFSLPRPVCPTSFCSRQVIISAPYNHSALQSSLARPRVPQNAFQTAPLVVMNNFGGEVHMKLATVGGGGRG